MYLLIIGDKIMKKKFECPAHTSEEIDNVYTVDECVDCWCFWDCRTGIEECLADEDFKDYVDELKKGLKQLS